MDAPDKQQSNAAIAAAVEKMVAWLESRKSAAPADLGPVFDGLIDEVRTSSLPADFVGSVLAALAEAVRTGNYGPVDGFGGADLS